MGFDRILDQLHVVNHNMNRLKTSPLAPMQMAIQNNVAPFLPQAFAQKSVYDGVWRHSMVFSNVPGPPESCLLVGKELTGLEILVTNLTPQVTFISYAGQIKGNLIVDPSAVPNADMIVALFSRSLKRLADELGVECPESIAHNMEN